MCPRNSGWNYAPCLTAFEPKYPHDLIVGNARFHLDVSAPDGVWIDQEAFSRIEGRTLDFVLYRQTVTQQPWEREQVIVFTPETLKKFLRDKQPPIARKIAPWVYTDVLNLAEIDTDEVQRRCENFQATLKRILSYDKMTEGDSLRLFNYLASCPQQYPTEFWPVILLWLRDETNHYAGFKATYERIFGVDTEQGALDSEPSDFAQFDEVFQDPFAVLLSLAYDEVSTVAGYNHDMPYYKSLGPNMEHFIRKVCTDEGWHFSKFVDLAVRHYSDRMDDAPALLEKAAHLDGRKYKRTFLLDHDPSVEAQFNEALKKQSVAIVLKVLKKRVVFGPKTERFEKSGS